jgi:hypothetical protein
MLRNYSFALLCKRLRYPGSNSHLKLSYCRMNNWL